MNVFALGATGGIGRAVVALAIARGHQVRAFVRSTRKLDRAPAALSVIEGDPRDPAPMQKAMTGCDAVVSMLGPPIPFTGRTTIMGDGAVATVRAMEAAGVRRLLIVSGDLQFPGGGPPWLVRATLLRHLARDQAELERVTRASSLEWTIVRPARLTDGASTGRYRAATDAMPDRPKAISRPDVAQFLVEAAERAEHVRQIVGLAT